MRQNVVRETEPQHSAQPRQGEALTLVCGVWLADSFEPMKTETPRKYIPRAERCCTCGRPRGLAQKRRDWGLQCPTAMIPHTPNPAEHGDQITNDIICNAGIWRNGGSDGDTHLCDDCLRVGLRVLKLKIDEALEVVEAGTDQRAELSGLTQRLAELQHHHQWLAYEHNRMQVRLGKMLDVIDAAGIAETDEIKHARFEVKRGPAIQKDDEYLWVAPAADSSANVGFSDAGRKDSQP